MIAKIIVDNKSKQVDKTFDYLVPKELEDKIKIGSRVLVRFLPVTEKLRDFVSALRIQVTVNVLNP